MPLKCYWKRDLFLLTNQKWRVQQKQEMFYSVHRTVGWELFCQWWSETHHRCHLRPSLYCRLTTVAYKTRGIKGNLIPWKWFHRCYTSDFNSSKPLFRITSVCLQGNDALWLSLETANSCCHFVGQNSFSWLLIMLSFVHPHRVFAILFDDAYTVMK